MSHNWKIIWLTDDMQGFRCSVCHTEVLEIEDAKGIECKAMLYPIDMPCKECPFCHSDSWYDTYWFICTHFPFEGDGKFIGKGKSMELIPDWCPLERRNNVISV